MAGESKVSPLPFTSLTDHLNLRSLSGFSMCSKQLRALLSNVELVIGELVERIFYYHH